MPARKPKTSPKDRTLETARKVWEEASEGLREASDERAAAEAAIRTNPASEKAYRTLVDSRRSYPDAVDAEASAWEDLRRAKGGNLPKAPRKAKPAPYFTGDATPVLDDFGADTFLRPCLVLEWEKSTDTRGQAFRLAADLVEGDVPVAEIRRPFADCRGKIVFETVPREREDLARAALARAMRIVEGVSIP